MRSDVYVKEVLGKCESLKRAGIWPPEPELRPRAWLNNFDEADRSLAAYLLEQFDYYDERLTDKLLLAAYNSLADGLPKGPKAPSRNQILSMLPNAIFTPVEGERPNRTDSGNLLCRKARQVLRIPQERVVEPTKALAYATRGNTIVFLDDLIGSGDQFVKTWKRRYSSAEPCSFADTFAARPFYAIYVALVATAIGLDQIRKKTPNVAVSTTHVLERSSTVYELRPSPPYPVPDVTSAVETMLKKYSPRLTPKEDYIAKNRLYKIFGYKKGGLMFAFAHSVPDATLPIFWAPGTDWTPLVERK